tara:strand:+ start:321 stop:830 length:510 start_codon:yes stop_codon:yes gene_type:complete
MNFKYYTRLMKAAPTMLLIIFGCSNSELKLKIIDAEGIVKQVQSHKQQEVVLLNFWATTCAPCIEEIPMILELADKYEEEGFRVYFASTDWLENKKKVVRFLEKHDIKGISFLKEEGNDFEFINAINKEWSGALPFTIIYDKNGNTYSYWENMQDKEFFETKIMEALAS